MQPAPASAIVTEAASRSVIRSEPMATGIVRVRDRISSLLSLTLGMLLAALTAPPETVRPAPPQTEADEYTRYELLPVETAQFRILYDVTATAEGATYFFNPIRKGSEASKESVADRMTGDALKFEVVSAEEARKTGLPDAAADTQFIRVALPRPVPAGGQVRLRIDKTYRDAASWFRDGNDAV